MNAERFSDVLDLLLEVIEKLPNPPREKVKREFTNIREMVMESRAPRILVFGRRGAGKSSLINAICGEKVAAVGSVLSETGKALWHDFQSSKGTLRILDTRGMGDRSRPDSADFDDALDDIKVEIEKECPDVVLFLCKAKEVDAHVEEDVRNVRKVIETTARIHDYGMPVAAVVTQVDELDPIRVAPPYEDEKKMKNIEGAVNALVQALMSGKIESMKVMPVSAYAEFEGDERTYDNYWNIDTLVEYLVDIMPQSAQLSLARLTKLRKAQRKVARVLVGSTATVCAGIATVPIPVADLLPITAAQIGMIIGVAYTSGRALSKKSAAEFLAALGVNVGAGFVLREATRAIVKFVFPGAGNAVSAAMAFAGTWGMGEAAIAYFIDGASIEEAKRRGEKAKEENTPPED